ncbi:MAG: hypothetical protein ACOCRK_08005 [bacterium]
MKFNKSITTLTIIIGVLSLIACTYGVFSNDGDGKYEIVSFRGEEVSIYGKGLYKNDSVSLVTQGISQDIVTIILAIPLLFISLCLARKGSLKGKLLLTGTIGYFLYTYMSYTFLWMYNEFFLVYVTIMSTSTFAFILAIMSLDIQKLKSSFTEKVPIRFLGGFQILLGIGLTMMWLKRIMSPIFNNESPTGLEHYTTMVIQAMDLAFIVPIAFLSGILILKKNSYGYLLTSIMIFKGATLGAAVTAMIIGQAFNGVDISSVEIIMFTLITLITSYCLFLLLKNIKEPDASKTTSNVLRQ